jgi:hypothetical protein
MSPSHPTYREAAPILCEQGWLSPIPIRPRTKAPDMPRGWPGPGGWGLFAASPPTADQIATMGVYAHPNAGVGLVVSGDFVCIDGDIRPKLGEPNHDQRLAAARDLMPRLLRLANSILGSTVFIRRSHNPKFALFYAPAGGSDAITIDVADNPIEVFGDLSSPRQVVIYGLHPDAGEPYGWIGGAAPLTHGPGYLPRVTGEQLRAYHDAANALAHAHDFMKSAPQKHGRNSRLEHNGSGRSTGQRGAIGSYIAAALRDIGRQRNRDPREVAREHLRQASERYNTMSGCVGALIICGYSDHEIIQALEETYRELFTSDELRSHMATFRASPAGLRRSMSRGLMSPLLPVDELDQQLNVASWSLFPVTRQAER